MVYTDVPLETLKAEPKGQGRVAHSPQCIAFEYRISM
jgi:hypothetical protein